MNLEALREWINEQIADTEKELAEMGYRDELYGGDHNRGYRNAMQNVLDKLDELETAHADQIWDDLFKRSEGKWDAIIEKVKAEHAAGLTRPIEELWEGIDAE